MTEVFQRMLSDDDDDDDSPAKCRERRRRRIQMRRFGATLGSGSEPAASHSIKKDSTEDSVAEGKRKRREAETKDLPVAAAGGSPSASSGDSMEQVASEAVPVEARVAEPVFGTMSVAGRARGMEDTIFARASLCRPEINRRRPVHFFAVYDGHGGPHVISRINFYIFIFFFCCRTKWSSKSLFKSERMK